MAGDTGSERSYR